jgi:pSer/pThr/pTyr-binding forkhead associated (FHA) protein
VSGPKAATASELKAELDAERTGAPFLVHRDEDLTHHVTTLGDQPLWIGRKSSADLCLSWDKWVSGIHAQLDPSGGEWTLVDDGLSKNGSFVNGQRITGRKRLLDGDMLRIGNTVIIFRAPGEGVSGTLASTSHDITTSLTDTQKRVLIALCRPLKDPGATPATNKAVSAEVFLGVDAVKVHLRTLSAKFGVEDLPQNSKRMALAQRALESGLFSQRDL